MSDRTPDELWQKIRDDLIAATYAEGPTSSTIEWDALTAACKRIATIYVEQARDEKFIAELREQRDAYRAALELALIGDANRQAVDAFLASRGIGDTEPEPRHPERLGEHDAETDPNYREAMRDAGRGHLLP